MATDAEGAGEAVEEGAEAPPEQEAEGAEGGAEGFPEGDEGDESGEDTPYFVEVWNDYDPSMRFVVLYPVGEDQGAAASTVAYYIFEPGKHSGLHMDNAEEVIFVAEGEGEIFMIGNTAKLEAGKFHVIPAGMEHDIYAQGAGEMRLLSFFPASEVISTFQQTVYPMGGNDISSKPPKPVVTELDPENLPEDFPFTLEDLGMTREPADAGEAAESEEPSLTRQLIGMAPSDEEAAAEPPEPASEPPAEA